MTRDPEPCVNWGTFHSWSKRSGNATTNADDQCVGQDYIDLYRLTRQSRSVLPTLRPVLMQRPAAPEAITGLGSTPFRCPCRFFAKMGKQYSSDPKYFSKMYSFVIIIPRLRSLFTIRRTICGGGTRRFKTAKINRGKNVYWSRGNGWVFAALARVLTELPVTDTHRQEYVTTFTGNGGRAQGSAAYRRFLERKSPGRPHAIRRAGSNRHRAFHFWPGLGRQ